MGTCKKGFLFFSTILFKNRLFSGGKQSGRLERTDVNCSCALFTSRQQLQSSTTVHL